jgi:hypothetical protein
VQVEEVAAGRISVAIRGVRFPAELSEILTWATYNDADARTRRELWSLPGRTYRNVTDNLDQIGSVDH